jgi:hypothetical protein
MKKPNGIVLYEGKSLLDGRAIVVIATGIKNKTENTKTGNLIQTWILCKNIPPLEAIKITKDKNGKDIPSKDKAICGNCIHREARSCYVNVALGPRSVYDAYKRKSYPKFEESMLEFFKDRAIRIGSYGDPAAAPVEVWQKIVSVCSIKTGYTHQWGKCNTALKDICMASVDTEKEYFLAKHHGWRTFRTRLKTDKVLDREFICPASKESGRLATCKTCGACSGGDSLAKTPVIVNHGPSWKMAYYKLCIIRKRNKKKFKGLVKHVSSKQNSPVIETVIESPAIQNSLALV